MQEAVGWTIIRRMRMAWACDHADHSIMEITVQDRLFP